MVAQRTRNSRRWWKDHCQNIRPGGNLGKKRRRKLKRRGLPVRMQLKWIGWRECWVELSPDRRLGKFTRLCSKKEERRVREAHSQYHISVYSRTISADPGAQNRYWRIHNHFSGEEVWHTTIPIGYVNAKTSVSWIRHMWWGLAPIWNDMQWLRQNYSCHTTPGISVSL